MNDRGAMAAIAAASRGFFSPDSRDSGQKKESRRCTRRSMTSATKGGLAWKLPPAFGSGAHAQKEPALPKGRSVSGKALQKEGK